MALDLCQNFISIFGEQADRILSHFVKCIYSDKIKVGIVTCHFMLNIGNIVVFLD